MLGHLHYSTKSSVRQRAKSKEQRIVSDGDLQPSGYIDHLFCHYCYQEQAIRSVLMTHAHICAEKTKYHSIF